MLSFKEYLVQKAVVFLFSWLLTIVIFHVIFIDSSCLAKPETLSEMDRFLGRGGITEAECYAQIEFWEGWKSVGLIAIPFALLLTVIMTGPRYRTKEIYKPIYRGKKIIHYEKEIVSERIN